MHAQGGIVVSKERFKADTSDSFFGHFLYEQVIPKDHFLMQLKSIVPWQRFSQELVQYYQGRAKHGRPPCDPGVVLKMLLLSFLYNISERQVEDLCNLYLPARCFLGLGVDERPPDHSTLSAFKKRILENGKLVAFEKLLRTVIRLALEQGIEHGRSDSRSGPVESGDQGRFGVGAGDVAEGGGGCGGDGRVGVGQQRRQEG